MFIVLRLFCQSPSRSAWIIIKPPVRVSGALSGTLTVNSELSTNKLTRHHILHFQLYNLKRLNVYSPPAFLPVSISECMDYY